MNPDSRMERVISGGQTGADIAALRAAKDTGLLTGGFAAYKFMTRKGPNPELGTIFGLVDHGLSHHDRTYANVKMADATLIVAHDFHSRGEICTINAINVYGKPYKAVNTPMSGDINNLVKDTALWIWKHKVKILNVAGNSEETYQGMERIAYSFLVLVFGQYQKGCIN